MTHERLLNALKEIRDDDTSFGECGESELNKAHYYALDLMEALPDIIALLEGKTVTNAWQEIKTLGS